jgi:small subunit ribosomal protein S11
MTEEKKITDNTDEKEVLENETAEAVVDDGTLEVTPEVKEAKSGQEVVGPEELPDEIKKKLEKQKASRTPLKGKRKKKGDKKRVSSGKAFVRSTYNNTVVTLTDNDGNVLAWSNAGLAGFKGPKKATPYAAQIITRIAVEKAKEEYGLSEVKVFVKGVGTGRESAVRALNANGLNITYIKDITPLPHNGCRARKPRRV